MKNCLLKKTLLLTAIPVTIGIAMCIPAWVKAQSPALKPNWQNLDLKTDSVFGISTKKAYTQLLQSKKHVPVIVAVIDGGVDINHEDLK